jgi:capsular polysaccharide transport system ATP-binding protein
MIKLRNVSKFYATRQGKQAVLKNINLTIAKGEKVGILGKNGSGKSTLIRILSGAESASSGQITRGIKVSWPLAFSDGFQGSLTGLDNLRFICRVYNVPFEPLVPFVQDFTELGQYLKEPVKTYSSGMRARLAFAISMAVEFDCYLIDEILAVGDAKFHAKCQHELFEKRKDRAMVMVSHMPDQIRSHCETFFVLKSGELTRFKDADEAYHFYEEAHR